ncbi:MAG: PhzF family phenazine biosynthesis protein [Pseudomonadota bacterium]
MRTYAFETWDVFTDQRFCGNPLAIVTNANGLSDHEMQMIAREFNLSETTFILPPDGPDHDVRVRIFIPTDELAFAGHPTIGTALSIATKRGSYDPMIMRLKAGDFPIRYDTAGPIPRATFRNPIDPTVKNLNGLRAPLAAALGLPIDAIADGLNAPCAAGAGTDFVFAKVNETDLPKCVIDSGALSSLYRDYGVGVGIFAEHQVPDADYQMRLFAPAANIPEDPATGSAACALPAVISRTGALADGDYTWTIRQGIEMRRPSTIKINFSISKKQPHALEVSGTAIQIQRGELTM